MRSLILSALIVCCGVPVIGEAAEFDKLVTQLPEGANTLLVIDPPRVLASQMAADHGWNSKARDGRSPVYLPPEAEKVVVAARVDPTRDFTRTWEAALISLTEPLSMSLLAKAEGGHADSINGLDAAWLPSDAYFVKMDSTLLGMRYPSDRQAVGRWADQQRAGVTSAMSVYLRSAASRIDDGPQIVMALDLANVPEPHRARQRLQQSEIVKKHRLDVEGVLKTLLSLKGITLEVTITDKAQGKLSIDFGERVNFSRQAGKEFFLAGLALFNVELPGLEKWTATVNTATVSLEGELNEDALRRVLSILDLPVTTGSLSGQTSASTESQDVDPKVKASQVYFNSVMTLVEDLKKHSKTSSRDAYWQERYSDKIDQLPILNVDADLLDFGEKTAQTLRVMAMSRTKGEISAGVRSSNTRASGDYGYTGYYGYQHRSAAGLSRTTHAIKSQEIGASNITRIEGYKLITDATVQMRRLLTERYNTAF